MFANSNFDILSRLREETGLHVALSGSPFPYRHSASMQLHHLPINIVNAVMRSVKRYAILSIAAIWTRIDVHRKSPTPDRSCVFATLRGEAY